MKTLFRIIICLSIVTLVACESQKHILVTVLDKDSGQALDSVLVQVDAGNNENYDKNSAEGYTDESGKYETHMMIGCSFGCYDIRMSYNKEGYKELVQINNIKDTVSLEKE